jgi:hypothetical protein
MTFRDGLGERFVASETVAGVPVEVLRLRPDITSLPEFETALRERATRLANFRNDCYARVICVHRFAATRGLAIVSEHVEGIRLSALLRAAETHQIPIDLNTALSVTRQLLRATIQLHDFAPDIANGLIAPERLIVTPRAGVTIAEQVLCPAVEQLQYHPDRLWRELRIAARQENGSVRFTHRTDVLSVGLVALSLVLGRSLRDDEQSDTLDGLLDAIRQRSDPGYAPLAPALGDWLACVLQLEPHRSFASTIQALRAFEQMVEAAALHLSLPIALEKILYRCTTALLKPSRIDSSACTTPQARQRPVAVDRTQPTPGRTPLVVLPQRVSAPTAPERAPLTVTVPERVAAAVPNGTVLTGQAGAVVTANDITQLFVEARPDRIGDSVARGEPADVSWDVLPACEPASGVSVSEPSAVPDHMADEPTSEMPIEPIQVTMLDASWSGPLAPPSRSLTWMRTRNTVAAALVALLVGGVSLNRVLRPEVVAASETGTLVIGTNPDGLDVLVDGIDLGRTPARLSLPAGDHIVEVRGPGVARILPVTIAHGAEVVHHLELGGVAQAGQPAATDDSVPPPAAPERAATDEPTFGWIEVRTKLPLTVRAGERIVGRSGGERIRFAVGRHQIELLNESTGYRTVRTVDVVPGKVTWVTIPAATGAVSLNATPWAEVWLSGQRLGETPLASVPVAVGRHEVFRHPEHGERRQTISVTADEPARLSVDMR